MVKPIMSDKFLYDSLDSAFELGLLVKKVPDYVSNNLNPKLKLRPYQIEAFARFFHCYNNDFPNKEYPLHFLWNMATGSGKTLIMAGLILYLYEKGYRNFLFFVSSTNIIEKTKDNFLNPLSSKFQFNQDILFGSRRVKIVPVKNFEGVSSNDINICFTTIQKLHIDMTTDKENSITLEDFKRDKVVLIADEAHHFNTKTKSDRELFESWENTVQKIFLQEENNLLLEFTATLDYTHANIIEKYRNKVLYRYDLRQYRNDGYSKDVHIVQADFEEQNRIIQTLILSQYKQEVAAKHRLNLKPVILFKAQKTIAQSNENKSNFHKIIENLTTKDILRIQEKSDIPLVQRAFKFFYENNISPEQLAIRIRSEFDEVHCLSVNEEKEKEDYQLLLNSLEDKNNTIRAIFAVQKLNEGWDVLNLFDIVRCYTTRDSKAGRPGKTTIAEAQLIGRGARYFPFIVKGNNDLYKRKFDNDLDNEIRVLEELHYHSINDSRYISELRTALIQEGIIDEKEIECKLLLKDAFTKTDFFREGIIYINERLINTYEHVKSFDDLGVKKKNYVHSIATGRGTTGSLLEESGNVREIAEAGQKDIPIKNIERHIIQNALAKNQFFTFASIKKYFPHLKSIHELISSENYLGGLELTFRGDFKEISNLTNKAKLEGLIGLLDKIESEVKQNITEYIGTRVFKPNKIDSVFYNKSLKLLNDSERANGDESFVADKEWYVFNANYGTSEEKSFVRMLNRQLDKLREKFDGIYLIRNERHFKLFNFSDGNAFEPDYVLFLKEKDRELLTYQLFIEPKGKHLKEHDKWKETFLKEITAYFEGRVLKFTVKHKYKLIGVPFYNNEDENRFKESLYESLAYNHL